MLIPGNTLKLERCPFCRIYLPLLTLIFETETANCNNKNHLKWKFYQCSNCGGIVSVNASVNSQFISDIFPEQNILDESIPHKAREYLKQAIDSLHAPAGSIMLAASSVDAMLKEKNYKDGSLCHRIDKAAEDHLITPDMAKWAHDIRLDANDQRHADDSTELPSESTAKKCIEFTQALAQFLFVLPARVDRGLEDSSQNETT